MKKCRLFIFGISILSFISACSIKKNPTSNPYFYSNEKIKKLTIKNLKPFSFSWENEEKNIQFTQFYKDSLDSIVVVKNGYFASAFYLKNNLIYSSAIKEFDEHGNLIQLDTIIPGVGDNKVYFFENEFSANAHSERTYDETGRLRKLKLNDANGYDSVLFVWNENGICVKSKNSVQEASYSDNGIIQTLRDNDRKTYQVFYTNGIVKSIKKDTLIDEFYIQYLQEFYPTGILHSEKFFSNEKSCHIWKEYRPDGTLLKKINKGQIYAPVPMGILTEDRYVSVVEQAHYKGSEKEFNDYLKTSLLNLFRNYKFLEGEYEILFEIDKTGNLKFISLKGYQSSQIENEINKLISQMRIWRNARKNGKPAIEVFKISFSFE